MLNIHHIVCNMLQENCYVVSDETKECVIIDCGVFFDKDKEALKRYITDNQLKPSRLLATHGHVDHNLGNAFVYDTYGLQPEVHEDDSQLLEHLPEQAAYLLNMPLEEQQPPLAPCLTEAHTIQWGNHCFTIIHTPGHTEGSCVFYCAEEGVAFTGDTLFRGSVGRVDLPGGSMFKMMQSIRHLSQLPDTTRVFSGHGPETTIGYELAHNPYLDR